MQIAEILSDLTSLRACDHTEALNLVNVNKTAKELESPKTSEKDSDSLELSRVKELVALHYGVKVKHLKNGPGSNPVVDDGLRRVREDVNRVLRELRNP
ncbi:uncharacterized protein TRUGW13939_04629 [Talaromyces rugulosus]|uniref:Uncharacterized protein n=1 Tax=Talaromyces rugulosus TaxID=121627 RepID=A0A7H8QVJ9_TALRU|nr:uncharacterized protein TRUGW13939_04629 [Talaromyces rugulosus]QKX57515.1 hypothetical protein TRUGW13939_04629 [Talaromyces rugulosus]